jgi:hypothetical protein
MGLVAHRSGCTTNMRYQPWLPSHGFALLLGVWLRSGMGGLESR